ncbi:MAG TPA: tetratricopeptide repeat protein, partial [Candidatus Saccharimonadales bacterium]|nr:tetratricopeptide repeat protein [Candidatus Saccharimonadales bacterium]
TPPPGTAPSPDGYVGATACTPCHREIAASYARTGMGRAFYRLTPATQVEDFTDRNRFEAPGERVAWEMSARDGRYAIRQIALGERGEELASVEREILYVVGSGNHTRSYVTGDDGYLYQMPVCWYPDKPGWDLCPGFEHNDQFFMREANRECLFCHNGRVRAAEGTTNRFTGPMPMGIGCERCHGPGARHVAYWKKSPEVMPERDTTIVNPARLEGRARIQVCMQCHLGETSGTQRIERTGRDLIDYRPGGDLLRFIDPIAVRPPEENLFGLTGQADRLIYSRCYRESGGAIDCLTCHDPHVSVYSIENRAAHFRAACLTCHADHPCALPEKERTGRPGGDDCVACHMRRSEPADLRFARFTDHWIRRRIDPPGPPPVTRHSLEMAPLFEAAHSEEVRAEAQADLGEAYVRIKQLTPSAAAIPWSVPEKVLRGALEADPSNAKAWYQLGKIALAQGSPTEALGDFREAVRAEPDHFLSLKEMGTTLLGLGRNDEAVKVLREAIQVKPDDLKSLTNLGRALVIAGKEDEGEEIFKSAAALAPAHSTPLANLGLLAERRGDHAEAVRYLREAAAREPSNAGIWNALASSLSLTGDREGAE